MYPGSSKNIGTSVHRPIIRNPQSRTQFKPSAQAGGYYNIKKDVAQRPDPMKPAPAVQSSEKPSEPLTRDEKMEFLIKRINELEHTVA